MKKIHIIGMAWYKPQNFQQLLGMFADGNTIRLSYPQWLKAAEFGMERHQREGKKVIKIDIDPVEFPRWCASKGMLLNAQSRIAYTNHVVANIGVADGTRQSERADAVPGLGY
jgi:hypothetical protein